MLLVIAGLASLWIARRGSQAAPNLPARAASERAALTAHSQAVEDEQGASPSRSALQPVAPVTGAVETGAPPKARPEQITLTLRFIGPDRGPLLPRRVRATLTDPAGGVRTAAAENAGSLHFEDLAAQRYVANVDAPGFTHRAQELELYGRSVPEEGLVEDVVLWPEAWIPIVVQTRDGQPLHALADALGIEPRRLFVDAFSAHAYPESFDEGEEAPGAPAPAEFHKPPVYQQWQLCESVVGALFLREPAPMWVRLELHGQPVGMQHLEPGQTELVFRISPAEHEASLARLRLRVLDAQTQAPVAGARATLRADTSAHRRADQEGVPTRDDGTLEFVRVVPGRYELTVQRGEAQYQERLELAPGDRRDLGDVRLGLGARLGVRVVDEHGDPLLAYIEVGPCEPGKNVKDLYPPMLHELTNEGGRGQLALPARVSIVRAQRMDPENMHPTGQFSANVRLDPEHPPAGELLLVIGEQAHVVIRCELAEARALKVRDALGLVVFEERIDAPRWNSGQRTLQLAGGNYRFELSDEAGAILLERLQELRSGAQELRLP